MTRRATFNGSTAGHRHGRRIAVQSTVTISAGAMHRPALSHVQVQTKDQHHTSASIENTTPIKFVTQDAVWQYQEYKRQLERAAIAYSDEFGNKLLDSRMCPPDVTIYAAGRHSGKSVTAR